MDKLIRELVKEGYLKTPSIIRAFSKIKREDFMPKAIRFRSGVNEALPIGHGATISQPLTVAFMLELLKPESGDNILDIGSGSGWTSALLADIVGPKGKVWAIEHIAKLKQFGEENAKKYDFSNLKFFKRDGVKGLPKEAPFDKILVSAAAFRIPLALKKQLKIKGRMVIPTAAQDIRILEKLGEGKFKEKIYQGFVFVPLIDKNL